MLEVVPACTADPLNDPSLARELAQRFFVWDAFVGGRRRVDVHPLLLSQAMHDAAVRAAEGVVRVVGRVASQAHGDATERARYGFDPDTLRLARASHQAGDRASLMRVDLLLDESGVWKACEINADCPGGHNETLALPRLARAAGFTAGNDPTHVVARLVARLHSLAEGRAVGIVHATGYAEDLQVCALVAREVERAGGRALLAPPTAPMLRGGELCIHGRPIGVLYRYFPTEWMSGQRNIDSIARAVEMQSLRTLTSFAHVFTQSKFALARAWAWLGVGARACSPPATHVFAGALSARAPFAPHGEELFRPEERDLVARHIPESHDLLDLDRGEIVPNRAAWVVKRAMGRVGDEVFVGQLFGAEDWALLVHTARERAAGGERWIAQRFVRQRPVPTPWGDRLVTLGTYVEDGRFVGYFARITPDSHVSHDALCVPVFLHRD
jgi:hypothetical protein